MGDANQPPNKPESSLQGTFKKRKTQEIDRLIETRKSGGTGSLPPITEPKRVTQTMDAPQSTSSATKFEFPALAERKRITQTTSPTPSIPVVPKRVSQPLAVSQPEISRPRPLNSLTPRQLKLLIIGMGVILVVVLAIGVLLLVTNQRPAAMRSNLPVVSAQEVITQLKKVNLPISNIRELASDSFWKAKQEIEFDVQRPGDNGSVVKGTFTVLSYDSSKEAGADALRAFGDETYKKWSLLPMSNIIVATVPETSANLVAELRSHMTEYLMAPYLPFLPRSTATASAATAAATAPK